MADAWIGWLGLGLLVLSWIPGTLRTIKEGRSGERPFFIVTYGLATLFLLAYSVQLKDEPFILLNGLALLLVGVQIYFLAVNNKTPKPGAKRKR